MIRTGQECLSLPDGSDNLTTNQPNVKVSENMQHQTVADTMLKRTTALFVPSFRHNQREERSREEPRVAQQSSLRLPLQTVVCVM